MQAFNGMKHDNIVEFSVSGDYALFSDPITRVGGEKCTYQIPTYEALKGIMQSIYWKPTIIWYIEAVKVMNPIRMEVKGIRPIKYNGGNDLAYYTYLKDCRYKVRARFGWNENHPELENDRNENKHFDIAKRMIEKGGRRDVFLGTRECQGYVEPCVFDDDEKGAYDDTPILEFGHMYHGITYADEAYDDVTRGKMTLNFWYPVMKKGVIEFVKPWDCPNKKTLHEMKIKQFGEDINNFVGLKEFEEGN